MCVWLYPYCTRSWSVKGGGGSYSIHILVCNVIECASKFFGDHNICRIVGVEDVNSLDLLGWDSFSWLLCWFLVNLLVTSKGEFFLWGRASAMTWDVVTWANLLCNRFEHANKVSLKVYCTFCWIIGMTFIVSLIKKLAALSEVSNKRFAFAIMVEINWYIC